MTNRHFLMLVLASAALTAGVASDALAQSVDFSKADTIGNDFVAWIRGNLATVVFTVAFVLTGFLAAFNRISWLWVLLVVVGAFLTFGAPTFVSSLRSAFS